MKILCLLIWWFWDFAIANLPLEMKSAGKKRRRKKRPQSQQDGNWKHQTNNKDLSFIKQYSSTPRVRPDLSHDEPSQEGLLEHYEKLNILYNSGPYQTLYIRHFTFSPTVMKNLIHTSLACTDSALKECMWREHYLLEITFFVSTSC